MGDPRKRQATERKESQGVEAVGLTDRRRHDPPDVELRLRDRSQPLETLAIVLADAVGEAKEEAQASLGRSASARRVGRCDEKINPGGAQGRDSADRGEVSLVDGRLGGVARPAPPAARQKLARADERSAPPELAVARRRGLAAEREQVERGERLGRQLWRGKASRLDAHRDSPLDSSAPHRGIIRLGSPSWSSTRPTTVSSTASIVAGLE